jgi:hypothetical protein
MDDIGCFQLSSSGEMKLHACHARRERDFAGERSFLSE